MTRHVDTRSPFLAPRQRLIHQDRHRGARRAVARQRLATYVGDCTADSLRIGSLVSIMLLRLFL
jgi:tyrosyl-tRNA synthetase